MSLFLFEAASEHFERLGVKGMQPGWPMRTLALHFVGFVNQIEAEEFFAEITLIKWLAKYGFVGILQLAQCEPLW